MTGRGTVVDNLAGALTDVSGPVALTILSLITSRDGLRARLRGTTPVGIPVLTEAGAMFASYLTAERAAGRIAAGADVDTLALTLIGTGQLLFAGREGAPPGAEEVRRWLPRLYGRGDAWRRAGGCHIRRFGGVFMPHSPHSSAGRDRRRRTSEEDTMALRVPKAELPAEFEQSLIKQLGAVPEPVAVMWHNPKVAAAAQQMGGKVGEWDVADESLKTFAHMAVAAQVGCSWCLDIGYFQAQQQNRDLAKASQVPRWRQSDVFTPLERDVLEYTEGMTQTPPDVTDKLSARLLDRLGPAALVELTVAVAFANFATRSNATLGVTSQGFSQACEIPLAARAGTDVAGTGGAQAAGAGTVRSGTAGAGTVRSGTAGAGTAGAQASGAGTAGAQASGAGTAGGVSSA